MKKLIIVLAITSLSMLLYSLPAFGGQLAKTAIPTGNTITIGTSQGSVTVNNFYKTADSIIAGQAVIIHQTAAYGIAYNVPDSSFTIAILSLPLEASRQAAETELLNALGISQQDACKLRAYEGVPANVSDKYVGKVFPLSFCGN